MSKQYPGGLITKTPVVPSGPYENSTASGIWTLDQQAAYAEQGIWPTAGNPPPDAQFNYVTMLLHGDGTNGAQNNTFLDSSTNNFTITRNGNTTQGSFGPYGDNWSNNFDGTGDYVQTGNATNLALSTGNFTIEGWFNRTSGSNNGLFQLSTTVGGFVASDVDNLAIGVAPTDLTLYANNSTLTSSTVSIPNGTWNHFALVRSGTTTTLYYNGVSVLSLTDSKNYTGTYLVIGGYYSTTYVWNGYISNLRIVKGTAVYTSNFTPPTAPLSAITNTQLLTCQANRFIDSSVNAYALTVSGNTSVQRFNPFGASAAYSTSVIGGSGYFDGSGDSLATASSADFGFGTGDFTIECWAYPLSSAAQRLVFFSNDINNLDLGFSSLDTFQYYNGSVNNTGVSASSRQWFHFAVSRISGTTSVYINGVRTNNITDSTDTTTRSVQIGNSPSSNPFNGYINDVRIIKGTGIYSGTTITVPTAPLTAVTNTKLLLNYTNGAIFDNAMMNDLETVGNAQISTSVVKFGTGSLYFDGTGDALKGQNNTPNLQFATGNFTVECWLYQTATNVYPSVLEIGSHATQPGGILFIASDGSTITAYNGTAGFLGTATAPALNTWNHIAWVRNNGVFKIYVNGVGNAGVAFTGNLNTSTSVTVGAEVALNASYTYTGYMDELRVTKGYARYTANFTPPTAAFQNIGPN